MIYTRKDSVQYSQRLCSYKQYPLYQKFVVFFFFFPVCLEANFYLPCRVISNSWNPKALFNAMGLPLPLDECHLVEAHLHMHLFAIKTILAE